MRGVQAISSSPAVLHFHCCWYLSVWYEEPLLLLVLVSAVGCQTPACAQSELPATTEHKVINRTSQSGDTGFFFPFV